MLLTTRWHASYVSLDPDSGLGRLAGDVAASDAHINRCRVQIVAFPQTGILKLPGTEAPASQGAAMMGVPNTGLAVGDEADVRAPQRDGHQRRDGPAAAHGRGERRHRLAGEDELV